MNENTELTIVIKDSQVFPNTCNSTTISKTKVSKSKPSFNKIRQISSGLFIFFKKKIPPGKNDENISYPAKPFILKNDKSGACKPRFKSKSNNQERKLKKSVMTPNKLHNGQSNADKLHNIQFKSNIHVSESSMMTPNELHNGQFISNSTVRESNSYQTFRTRLAESLMLNNKLNRMNLNPFYQNFLLTMQI